MSQLDRANLAAITVYVGEKDYHQRQKLREMFVAEGIKNISTHANAQSLRSLMFETPPDLLVLSDDFDDDVFELAKEVRFNRLGQNPFIIISFLINPRNTENIEKAIKVGADDIVIKPVDSQKVHDRLRLTANHRQPFVATSEYVGPDRKSEQDRHPGARRVDVLNTLKEKANGRTFEQWELKEAVDECLNKVVEAQLSSQSMKMGALCDVILEAYRGNLVTVQVKRNFAELTEILREASNMATQLKDDSLQTLCLSLAENVSMMEINYETLEDSDIDLIDKLSQAFRMAIDSAAQRTQNEEEELAAKYEGRVAGDAIDI
ncbi:MAG: response regulator [Rhodospirillaceae bacterium]|jgi:DNA-binding response OmpR family regulator|nr:response regulator [Rhodospirillaceae bacterium]MBT5241497.1 response regulator [Rhodospirillaceae bacterium]MBT5566233.1 response regulator [Rhodospirillaceae bacterium]MBT6088951.1 response regulator [Rhodospirillaceae bacterium]MBT7451975.1 response regulator [Rhodospirillaceae bacterium]